MAAALETVACLLLAVGVILDSITHHEKLKAELHYLDVHRRSIADESRLTGQP